MPSPMRANVPAMGTSFRHSHAPNPHRHRTRKAVPQTLGDQVLDGSLSEHSISVINKSPRVRPPPAAGVTPAGEGVWLSPRFESKSLERQELDAMARDKPGDAIRASQRDAWRQTGKRHGNYPWVGGARRALGYGPNIAGGSSMISGIGPSPLHLEGMGGLDFGASRWTRKGDRLLAAGCKFCPKTAPNRARSRAQNRLGSPEAPATSAEPARLSYTRYELHEFGTEGDGLLALRPKNYHHVVPGPGQYAVHSHVGQAGSGASFAPARRADSQHCTLGRSCDLHATPQARMRLLDGDFSRRRQPGPLFDADLARRSRRRPHSAMEAQSRLSIGALSIPNSHAAPAARPTLKHFLRRFQDSIDPRFRSGGPHTAPARRRVTRNLWRQTSMADYTSQRMAIVWDKEKRRNVTICGDADYITAQTRQKMLMRGSGSWSRPVSAPCRLRPRMDDDLREKATALAESTEQDTESFFRDLFEKFCASGSGLAGQE